MKVKIGPYKSYWGAYQIADLLQKVGVSEDRCYEIGKWLSETKLQEFLEWIHSKRNRKVYIKIDNFDAWNADFTIGLVINAVIKELLRQDCGYGRMDKEDVPARFHKEMEGNSVEGEESYRPEGYSHAAWTWMLEEIIWATDPEWSDVYDMDFSSLEKWEENWNRRNNAMRLFGKYFFSFWN